MKHFLSYSELNLWFRDRKKYLERYIEGKEEPETPEQTLGKIVHETLANPQYPWLKEMIEKGFDKKKQLKVRRILTTMYPRIPEEKEYTLTAQIQKIPVRILGIFDGFDLKDRRLIEYKTTESERWSQWVVDDHEQLTFYAYLYWLAKHAFLTEIILYRLHVGKGTVKTFRTTRGPKDIQYMRDKVERCYLEMVNFGIWEKRLSRKERAAARTLPLFPDVVPKEREQVREPAQ